MIFKTVQNKAEITVYMANPRGFCAGVERAIQIVEQALNLYGKPVYVRHEIVHNAYVVENLKKKGAIFVKSLSECDLSKPVIFSAHGVPKIISKQAEALNMNYIDATCPLVSKVHYEAQRLYKKGCHIILIGHAGHPEVIGTMGQLPEQSMTLIETLKDAKTYSLENLDKQLAYITQTTLSIEDTKAIIECLKSRFPDIIAPHKEDICYATTNRQAAVKSLAQKCNLIYIIGASNSSNSKRLVEVALKTGANEAFLIRDYTDIEWEKIKQYTVFGLSASASAPEVLVEDVLNQVKKRFSLTIKTISVIEENIAFKLPKFASV